MQFVSLSQKFPIRKHAMKRELFFLSLIFIALRKALIDTRQESNVTLSTIYSKWNLHFARDAILKNKVLRWTTVSSHLIVILRDFVDVSLKTKVSAKSRLLGTNTNDIHPFFLANWFRDQSWLESPVQLGTLLSSLCTDCSFCGSQP